MNRGVYIKVQNDFRIQTWMKIISMFTASNRRWHVDCLDCLNESDISSGIYHSEELIEIFKCAPDIFSARMICGGADCTFPPNIESVNDYLASGCDAIVLCVDGVHFEVLSENNVELEKLYTLFAHKNGCQIRWIDCNFDGRTDFRV